MKFSQLKIVIVSVSIFCFSLVSEWQNRDLDSESISLEWGRGYYCEGRGLCSAALESKSDANAKVYFNTETGSVKFIEVFKDQRVAEQLERQFSTGRFQIERPLEIFIPSIERDIKLSTGDYKVKSDLRSYKILFNDKIKSQ